MPSDGLTDTLVEPINIISHSSGLPCLFDIILTCVDWPVVGQSIVLHYESQSMLEENKQVWEKCHSNINEYYGTTVDLGMQIFNLSYLRHYT